MGGIVKIIALSIPPESTMGLIPLVTWLCVALGGLVGVCFYGVLRVRKSEGLAPGRVDQPYDGPALSWDPRAERGPKLVSHDTLGLAADLAWLNRRTEVPASLEAPLYPSEPIIALEFAAKVFSPSLSAPVENQPLLQNFSAGTPAAEKLAALKNPVPAPQPKPVTAPPAGVRLRTAVLRAADPMAHWTPARTAANPGPGVKAPSTASTKAASAPATSHAAVPQMRPVAQKISATLAEKPAPLPSHIAPLAAALAAMNPAPSAVPAIEGKVTEYSFSDFLSAAPETENSQSTNANRR